MEKVFMTVKEFAEQLNRSTETIREWGRRKDDPLPIKVVKGTDKGQFLVVSEAMEWLDRNTELYRDANRNYLIGGYRDY